MLAELRAISQHIDERHKEGANMNTLKKKAETLESKNDPKASVARSEADRAEDSYNSKHDNTLQELKNWKVCLWFLFLSFFCCFFFFFRTALGLASARSSMRLKLSLCFCSEIEGKGVFVFSKKNIILSNPPVKCLNPDLLKSYKKLF
jgi:hypothetical protein